ncbi:hypothetical protein [Pseudomonas putida]
MEAFEKRHPRARFTKQLSRICHALDAASAHDVAYRLYGDEYVSRVAACELWVVGSYARGALLCADLDIVVENCIPLDHPFALPLTNHLHST